VTGSRADGNNSACTLPSPSCFDYVACATSSVITGVVTSATDEHIACFSHTANPALALMGSEDLDGLNLGIPAFVLTNARVRKFSFESVLNGERVFVTQTLEDCQSLCKANFDHCVTGTWQVCAAVKPYCPEVPGNDELGVTCAACAAVQVSGAVVPFPANWGACKLASKVETFGQKCVPEPCYAFEGGDDRFEILAVTKSNLINEDGTPIARILMGGAYQLASDLLDCQARCAENKACSYGHFEPATFGYGRCLLTNAEMQVLRAGVFVLANTPAKCSNCVVFKKLPAV
jgi:hypothetical protein